MSSNLFTIYYRNTIIFIYFYFYCPTNTHGDLATPFFIIILTPPREVIVYTPPPPSHVNINLPPCPSGAITRTEIQRTPGQFIYCVSTTCSYITYRECYPAKASFPYHSNFEVFPVCFKFS